MPKISNHLSRLSQLYRAVNRASPPELLLQTFSGCLLSCRCQLLAPIFSAHTSLPPRSSPNSLGLLHRPPRNTPTLPPKPSPSQRLRYKFHKLYFNYLVTGPGYVLEPAERACLDGVALALTGALLYCLYVFLPNVVSVLQLSSAFNWGWKDSFGAGIGLKRDVVMAHMSMNQSLARIDGSEVARM